MKKIYLLILLCCISNKAMYVDAQLEREIRQQQDHSILIELNKYEAINKIKEEAYRENYKEITQLKKDHAREITVYEEKIATLVASCKEKDRKIAGLLFEREQKSIENWHRDRTNKIVERVLEDDK